MDKFDGLAQLKQIGMQLDPATSTDVYYKEPGTNLILPIEDSKAIYNLEQRKVASVVSKEYALIEHRPIVDEYVDILSKFNLNCFGNVLNYGNQMYIETAFGNRDIVDGVKLGVRLKNSYNTYTSFGLEAFGYRTLCANGMFLGKVTKKQISVSRMHIGDIKLRDIITNFIKNLVESDIELEQYISNAMKDSIEWDVAEQLILTAISKKHTNGIFLTMLTALETKGTLSRWQLYNALTFYTSHQMLSDLVTDKIQSIAQDILVTPTERLITVVSK